MRIDDIEEKETENKEDKKIASTENKKSDKSGFDDSERLTLKINVKEATRYDAIKDRKTTKPKKNVKKTPKNVYREHEEEEEDDRESVDKYVIRSLQELQINQNDASNGDTSLINALLPNEKRQIEQSTNIEITRQEQNAGRHDALEKTDTMLRKSGMKKMSTQEFMDQMRDAIYEPGNLKRSALEDNLVKKIGIKGEITPHNEQNVVNGVRKINEVTEHRRVEKVTTKDAAKIGGQKLSNNQTAELILEKSGQKSKLEEIKKQSVSNNYETDNKGQHNKKSYAKDMKELLNATLGKKNKQR